MGLVTRDVPVGHPDFGKAFPCVCQREALETRRNKRLRALSNLDIVADKTFDTFNVNLDGLTREQMESLRTTHDQAWRYANQPDPPWLLLQGPVGCGKTHLAAAIANYRFERGTQVIFATAPDLLDHLRATYGPNAEIGYDELFERVRTAELLIMDDLGAESSTPWAQEKLYQIINYRYMRRLPTVYTTNLTLAEIDQRIRSRVVDDHLGRSIQINVPDFRRGFIQAQQSPLSSLELYGEMVFETFDLRENTLPERERRNLRDAFEITYAYAQSPQNWLVLMGTHGCGKTHLAAAIANFAYQIANMHVIFITAANLLDYLRAAFNSGATDSLEARLLELREIDLLVIDHLDLKSATSWALEKMQQIIDHRYLSKSPTVFTTATKIEELDPMLRSRFLDTRYCRVFSIVAPDYRGGAAPRNR